MNQLYGGRGIHQNAALSIGCGNCTECLPHPGMEAWIHPLIPVCLAATISHPFDRHDFRHVQNQGQIGVQPQQPDLFGNEADVSSLTVTLIGQRGVVEPVADNPSAGFQRRPDGSRDVVSPGCEVQQRLSLRRPVHWPAKQDAPQQFSTWRPARFARLYNGAAPGFQGVGQKG